MSQISTSQGAVKLSEVATDLAKALIATGTLEDGMTVLSQTLSVLTDSLKRSAGALILTSHNPVATGPGTISWTGSAISFGSNTNIVLKLLQNESGNVVDLTATYGSSDGAATFNNLPLASGEVLYIEIDRSLVPGSGSLVLQNAVSGGSLVAGQTIKKATAGPTLASAMTGPTGTLSIPLAINIEGALWWIPHGIYWPANTASPLGAVVTSTSIPVGAMIPYYSFTGITLQGYTAAKAVAPGFMLCDGSIVRDPASSLFNPTRNPDGTPTVSYNPALDRFAPNMNGEPPTWNSSNSYNEGDYVLSLPSTRYVSIQAVPPGILITNTAYWQPESTYNNTSSANPYNRYRKSTQNQTSGVYNNTYPRGSNVSSNANVGTGYTGSNTKTLAAGNLPAHSHNFSGTTSGDSPDHSHSISTRNNGNLSNGGGVGGVSANNGASSSTNGRSNQHTHTYSGTTDGGNGLSNTAFGIEPCAFNVIWLVRIY